MNSPSVNAADDPRESSPGSSRYLRSFSRLRDGRLKRSRFTGFIECNGADKAVWFEGQNRALKVVEYAFGRVSHDQTRKTRARHRSHHDEINVLFSSKPTDCDLRFSPKKMNIPSQNAVLMTCQESRCRVSDFLLAARLQLFKFVWHQSSLEHLFVPDRPSMSDRETTLMIAAD